MTKIIPATLLVSAGATLAGYTTRHLGSNYQQLATLVGAHISRFQALKQIHSTQVCELTKPIGLELLEGDALVTNNPDFIIGVRVADCLPILLFDKNTGYKAAIHAGWRGLVGGIIENTLEFLVKKNVQLSDCYVSMGPCICDKCFEVGPEVASEFRNKFPLSDSIVNSSVRDRSLIHLKKAALMVLKQNQVSESSIEILSDCTLCQNQLWPSYRKGDKVLRSFCFI